MGSDAAISNVSPVPRDLGRKKKTNRSARLKQCKLDARREQWLSQGKNKGSKATEDDLSQSPPCPSQRSLIGNQMDLENLGKNGSRVEGNDRSRATNLRDQRLSIDIPSILTWENSLRADCTNNSLGSLSSSTGSYSRSVSDADDYDEDEGHSRGGEEGGLDDWEAVADALTSNESSQSHPKKDVNVASAGSTAAIEMPSDPSRGILRNPPEQKLVARAWKPDDAFRPRSLPNLPKQRIFSKNLGQSCGGGNAGWLCRNFDSQPLPCPICYEDLDLTDSSFLPCSCGFRLCLFCHKRIIEADSRCPGCRKQYSDITSSEMLMTGVAPIMHTRPSHSRRTSARP